MESRPFEPGARVPLHLLRRAAPAGEARPWVLACASTWRPPDGDARALRAELRGLGATLVVATPEAVWRLAPDDPLEVLPLTAAQVRATLGGDGLDRVAVLDEDDTVVFAHATPPGDLGDQLVDALSAAGDALRTPAPRTFTRRQWALSCLCAGFAMTLLGGCHRATPTPPAPPRAPSAAELDVELDVNGARRRLRIEPRVSLLDALRERLGLTGTKKGCDHGQCGACTVHLDGRAVNACLTLAVMAQRKAITTVEGLARGEALHPVQAAFIAHDALQCGYCTPGQIMSAVALLAEGHARTDDEVREAMSGNLCRCGAYPNIVAAVQAARRS